MEGKNGAEGPHIAGHEVKKQRVVVGLSGGLDSTIALHLLREEGFEVIGVILILLDEHENTLVPQIELITKKFKIPLEILDLRSEFEREVVSYFVNEYRSGRTPNPCALCNRFIKFKGLEIARKKTRSSYIATGHYARLTEIHGRKLIKRGVDPSKDQSYFLALIEGNLLEKLIFPLGDYLKSDVKKLAKELGLLDITRPESQEICFLRGEKSYREFLEQKLGNLEGRILDKDGNVLGSHTGYYRFTLGQRRGTRVAKGRRLYVISINPETRDVILGERKDALKRIIKVEKLNFFDEIKPHNKYLVRIRQNHIPALAVILKLTKESAVVKFEEPQWAPTPGQVAAFYEDDILVAGGIISEILD